MSQPLDSDLLDDLGEPEGRAMDEGDLGDLGDPLDMDPLDAGEGYELDAADAMDELEDAVTEALDAEDADEFLGNLWKGIRSVARKVAPIVSQVAPLLPIPGASLIGKAADVVSKVAADEADELDALDGVIESADEADEFDAAAPIAAALAVRKAIPNAGRIPHPQRKQLVRATAAATREIADRHGKAAAAAVPAIVRQARRAAVQRGASVQQLPQLVRRTAAKVAQSPHLVRRFARASRAMRTAPAVGGAGYGAPGIGGGYGAPGIGGGPMMGERMGYGRRGLARRRRGARSGRYGYGYGGGSGDRHITLRPGSRIIIASL
jgi:hypothetical protein